MLEPTIEWDRSVATLVVDGHPQSAVDVDDPTNVVFEYVRGIVLALTVLAPEGPLRVTHVGGAGMTLARWVQATRPGSPQIVLEPDAALTEIVRRELPLSRGHRIRVRPQTGEVGLPAMATASADVVVLDAYAAGRVPAALTSVEWFAEVARVLTPGGLLLANLADEPGLAWVGRVHASVQKSLGHTAFIALHEVLKGKRYGNLVMVATREALDVDALRRAAAREPWPTGVLTAADLSRRAPGARPFVAATGDVAPSPEPPVGNAWRRR